MGQRELPRGFCSLAPPPHPPPLSRAISKVRKHKRRSPFPCPLHLQEAQLQKKVCKFGKRREIQGEAPSNVAHPEGAPTVPGLGSLPA